MTRDGFKIDVRLSERWLGGNYANAQAEFQRDGLTVLPNFLSARAANRIYAGFSELNRRDLWYQAVCGDPTFVDEAFGTYSAESRRRHFSYSFDQYPILDVFLDSRAGPGPFTSRRDMLLGITKKEIRRLRRIMAAPQVELRPTNPLRALRTFLASASFAKLAAGVTGLPIARGFLTGQVSRYRSGSYVSLHTDESKTRLCAFVIYLTPLWLPHWGGHLLIFDQQGRLPQGVILPEFNSLLLFKTPRAHAVTAVGPDCPRYRYAVFGWFLRPAV